MAPGDTDCCIASLLAVSAATIVVAITVCVTMSPLMVITLFVVYLVHDDDVDDVDLDEVFDLEVDDDRLEVVGELDEEGVFDG